MPFPALPVLRHLWALDKFGPIAFSLSLCTGCFWLF